MENQTSERLKQAYGYAEWGAPSDDGAHRSITGLAVPGGQLDGWTAQRVSPIKVPGASAAYRSIWRSLDSVDAVVSLEVIETSGAQEAREVLLELLGEFQSPVLEGPQQNIADEIAFSMPGDTALLFARANVVAMVRNAGRNVVSVLDFAQWVDKSLA